MGQRKRHQNPRREALHEVLNRLEPALRQLNGLIALNRHLAAAEDAVESAVFEVLAGSLELAQSEFPESYSQLRRLAATYDPRAFPGLARSDWTSAAPQACVLPVP